MLWDKETLLGKVDRPIGLILRAFVEMKLQKSAQFDLVKSTSV